MMFGSRVGFSAMLRFICKGLSYTHCCRALIFASARLSCLHMSRLVYTENVYNMRVYSFYYLKWRHLVNRFNTT